MRPLDRVSSIKVKLGAIVVVATGAGLIGAVYGLDAGVRVRYMLVLSIALALVVVQLLARGMTAPLREMASAARRMARGDHDVRVETSSRDEVGQLAEAFNRMAADLAAVDAQRRRLVADVSHELRTPLTALQALLENLADGVTEPEPEALETAVAQTKRLSRLVAQLLDLSRLEAGQVPLHREDVDLAELVQESVRQAPDRDVTVTAEVPEGLRVSADPERLQQVLANLLDNATRHSPAGGVVAVTAERLPYGLRLVVADQGPGIAPADRERVFDRFTRTDAARGRDEGGSGLGLAIARWVVDLHGGRIAVLDPVPPMTGCRIAVTLPEERP